MIEFFQKLKDSKVLDNVKNINNTLSAIYAGEKKEAALEKKEREKAEKERSPRTTEERGQKKISPTVDSKRCGKPFGSTALGLDGPSYHCAKETKDKDKGKEKGKKKGKSKGKGKEKNREDPINGPRQWQLIQPLDGTPYYFNQQTAESSWTPPEGGRRRRPRSRAK